MWMTVAFILIGIGSGTVFLLATLISILYLVDRWWLWSFDRAIGWKEIKKRLEEKNDL
ncbi:hypothetical protein LCGC14_2868340 [marine sediment metagenome]|uniref:Uncharacterized protein n=1 Tax=marine sediment metagenome TaxID=412755 RepID=A0A0F8Y3J0_9ZZZZ